MLTIHNEGKGICGVFPLDIAETKANQVVSLLELINILDVKYKNKENRRIINY